MMQNIQMTSSILDMNEIARPLYFFLSVVTNPQLNHFKPTTLSQTVAHLQRYTTH